MLVVFLCTMNSLICLKSMSCCKWHLKKTKLYALHYVFIPHLNMQLMCLECLTSSYQNSLSPIQLWARGLIECGDDDHVLDGLLEENLVSHIISVYNHNIIIIIIVVNVCSQITRFWSCGYVLLNYSF